MENYPNPNSNAKAAKDSYQILRHTLRSNQYQPVKSLGMADSRRSRENIYSRYLAHHLSSCSIALMAFIITISFFYVVMSLEVTAAIWRNSATGNLMLSPFIESGKISEAKEMSKVTLFPGIKSYSGFLTVDVDCKSHLFFWFFPAASGNLSAPLILWHGGGPGTSALFGLFQGTGPVLIDPEGNSWNENKFSWTAYRSVLYLDSPVGAGFSFNEHDDARCYASSSDDVADQAINALRQFYQLFPEYQPNDFYISTTSYGGKFAPTIAWRIHNENQLDALNGLPKTSSINLKGVISMSGFTDPIHQIDYGEFYYNLGFIDSLQLKVFQSQESVAKSYIRSKRFYEAYEVIDPMIVGTSEGPSYLKNVTGILYPYNFQTDARETKANKLLYRHDIFLNQRWVQEAIHVDTSAIGHGFKSSSDVVYINLLRDLYKSVSSLVEKLLDSGEYKFLFTSGQMDLIVPHTTVSKFLRELRWGSEHSFRTMVTSPFAMMPSSLWMHKNKVVGSIKTIQNLTYLLIRDAGHHPFIDQPEWTLDFILKFTDSETKF